MAGMLAGLAVTLFYVFAHKGIFFIKGTDFLPMIGGANSFFGITPDTSRLKPSVPSARRSTSSLPSLSTR